MLQVLSDVLREREGCSVAIEVRKLWLHEIAFNVSVPKGRAKCSIVTHSTLSSNLI